MTHRPGTGDLYYILKKLRAALAAIFVFDLSDITDDEFRFGIINLMEDVATVPEWLRYPPIVPSPEYTEYKRGVCDKIDHKLGFDQIENNEEETS